MRHANKKILSASIFISTLISGISNVQALPAPVVTGSLNGSIYTITSVNTSYNASSALLESQPWWGNQSLAFSLNEIYYRAQNSGLVLFAYGLSGNYVSITYGSGGRVTDCPQGCPQKTGSYSYATGSSEVIQQVQLTLGSVASSLASTAAGVNSITSNINMLMNGAHSRPLSRLVEPGKNTVWFGGDWGRDDHGRREGSSGLAEIGIGHNLGFVQLNATLGQTWARQHLTDNGRVDADGQYLMLEAIVPVYEPERIYATLGGFGHWGESDIRRGYINMGRNEVSKGSPNTNIWGVRARLDWVDALTLHETGISPYVDLSYTQSRIDGYTEKSGTFPARFDGQSDDYSEARLGFNTQTPLPLAGFNFVSNLEAVHRFEDRTSGVSGEVTGVFDFSLPGEQVRNDWVKAGAGIEGLIGPGKATLMLNGTSKSEMPNLWLAASYQLTF
ncbi:MULTISPECIES: autotransporter outer membrane beta-barrel domain-containing protein [Pseudomonas]|uniref:Autotransporter outer membrane beta-barrel domain-containing protein n=1 Tax=Pseudomonas tritici TaxID=2745518 RepID=A0A8H9YWP0_9PSED|nr:MULTISPECIES: autotransporter outer membrane beta-barrel domain-containing protein [Pseudomonas]MBP2870030.1 autotransporter outer membrane beta-barrel domain-containing protein [Pseudomonas sp. SWRI144]QXH81351.1 autotransporter outer membrane beta-barrel domain-containing protein [Pseudomonas tritici]